MIYSKAGRLGYISTSTFFKAGSGKPLRDFLRSKATLETAIDFGDLQAFEGVTAYSDGIGTGSISRAGRSTWPAAPIGPGSAIFRPNGDSPLSRTVLLSARARCGEPSVWIERICVGNFASCDLK